MSILSLPRELRDIIVDIVLTSTVSMPTKPAATEKRDGPTSGAEEHREAKEEYTTTSLPLLLVNRQFYAETKDAIGKFLEEDELQNRPIWGTRRKRRELTYKFDIMLVNDTYVWPSRVCVPFLARRVDNVDVTIQAFGTAPVTRETLSGVNAFKSDMGATEVQWSFYRLLVYLLRHGPRREMWTQRRPLQNKSIKGGLRPTSPNNNTAIGVLTIDFQKSTDNIATDDIFDNWTESEEYYSFAEWKSCRGNPFQEKGWEDVHRIVVRPQWLKRYLVSRLMYMLSMNYHAAEYSSILYETIGSIKILLDGVFQTEVHLAEKLAALRYDNATDTFGHLQREDRLDAFWKWKREALRLRRERGLPVIYPTDPELEDIPPTV
ncbi:uncharacterized protein GIQ15_06762 [Arthroderma uncinatum]|uniref:uncharacterized protein n=1 Tax=Arthroderma uncinatum TaxID=74035 RepID=UPI00144A8628|nr:uncharacterized protein GIQ15_06762 [Arthroderma uncinatum]KAF3479786.1 hypothetical protein GIQ15_06762 [Arthroderma uncinatum]